MVSRKQDYVLQYITCFKLSIVVNEIVSNHRNNFVASRLIVKWSSNCADTVKEIREIAGFLGVIVVIDATYTNICPPSDQHNAYLDRTMKHIVILLAVYDVVKKSPI